MAGVFYDDSTDDEIGVNLQLAERLQINRGDNSKFDDGQKFENSKDVKQFYNLHRKKCVQDGQSSSSSSDSLLSNITSSDTYHNKKRQNGDKNTEQLANPKRTCLSDRYRRLPEWRDLKKKSNGCQSEQVKCPHFHLQSPDIFPSKKSEKQMNNLADADDSDSEIPRFSRNAKGNNHSLKYSRNQTSVPKTVHFQNFDETAPSTSYMNNLFESGSDEDNITGICKNGALKGGRQETPDDTYYAKRLFGRKVNKKVLDSDESEDESWTSNYRSTKPLVFSSSDSEDFKKSSDKNKHVSNDTSNGSSSQSLSHDGFERNSLRSSRQYKSARPNQKCPKRSVCVMSPYRADSSDSCDRQFLSSDFHAKNTCNRPCRARRSPRINMAPSTASNGYTNGSSTSNPIRGRRHNGGERCTRRSGSPHHRNIRSQYRDHDNKCTRGRSVSTSRSKKDISDFASRYPDVFDAEESENEFFTANSYSDTETSTESLGSLVSSGKFSNHRSPGSCVLNCDENRFEDISTDDEISVVFSSAPHGRNCELRRSSSRTLGRRCNRGGTSHRQLQSSQEVVSLSPDPVEQVRQVEEDERIARLLQEQFDAEVDPDFIPVSPEVVLPHVDSDNDIDPVLDESDSDGGRRYSSYTTFPRRPFRANRFPNRPGTPNAFSATFFFSPRRNNSRSRRRYQAPREQRSDWPLARLFGLGLTVPAIFDGEDDYETLLSLDLNGEVVPRGLQKTQINRLPTRKYIHPNSAGNSEIAHKRAELNKECQVCLTDYETGDTLRILPCFHEFHTPCIDPWLKINHTCPVCRVSVDLDA